MIETPLARPEVWQTASRPTFSHESITGRAPAWATVYPGGCVLGTYQGTGTIGRPASNTRGAIRGFSRKARRRMRVRLLSLDFEELAGRVWFLSLTYHQDWGTPAEWKADLRAFRKRVLREWPEAGAVWRLEFQQRGAPHFHLLLTIGRAPHDGEDVRALVSAWWHDIAEPSSSWHARYGCDCRAVWGVGTQLRNYLVKYMAKQQPEQADEPGVGRWWATFGRLPRRVLGVAQFREWEDYLAFLERMRAARGACSRTFRSLSGQWRGAVLLLDPDLVDELLEGLEVTVHRDRPP